MRRLSVFMCFCLLVSIFTFTGCEERSKPIDAVIQDDITVINITHALGGQISKYTVEEDSLVDLRTSVGSGASGTRNVR